MNWLDVAPVALVCVGWLIIPGLLVSYAVGFRSIAAWAVAPTLSVAVITMTAVVAGKLGVQWSVPLVLIASLGVAVVAAIVALLVRRGSREADPRPVTAAAFLGLLPAIVLGTLTVMGGMGSPDGLSQTFDAVFHYNAVAFILDSHNASPLTITTLGNPNMPGGFYPAAWHDIASLVVLATGTTIPVAANLLTGALALVVWPLSCILLVRQVIGRSVPAMAVTGVLSIGFTAFPWELMSFGVLWPNLLGLALVPVGVAVTVSLAGLATDDAIGKGRAWLMLPFVLVAGGLAHPNSLFSLVAIMVFPLFTGIGRWALRMRAEGRTGRGLVGFGLAVVVFLGSWAFVAVSPIFATVRNFQWAPFERTSQALGEALLGATNRRPSLWVLSAVVVIGAVLVWKLRNQRWLIGAFAGSVFLFVLTAAVNSPLTHRITGYWYNDPFRLAAILPVTAVPLAVLGIVHLSTLLRDKFAAGERPRLGRFGASTLGIALVLTLLVAVGGKAMYLRIHSDAIALNYVSQDDTTTGNLVDARERAFYTRIQKDIPPDAVVANNPWDGSALLWGLVDRRPLFPHLDLPWSDQQRYLAEHLVDAASDPKVCQAAKQLGVGYVVLGNQHFWPWDAHIKNYPGIVDPAGKRGFQLVDSDQDLKLYKLTAC